MQTKCQSESPIYPSKSDVVPGSLSLPLPYCTLHSQSQAPNCPTPTRAAAKPPLILPFHLD